MLTVFEGIFVQKLVKRNFCTHLALSATWALEQCTSAPSLQCLTRRLHCSSLHLSPPSSSRMYYLLFAAYITTTAWNAEFWSHNCRYLNQLWCLIYASSLGAVYVTCSIGSCLLCMQDGEGLAVWVNIRIIPLVHLCSLLSHGLSHVILPWYVFKLSLGNSNVRPQYSEASPTLKPNTLQTWPLKVGSSDILCVTVHGSRETEVQWSYNETQLDIFEVPIATENCTYCRREECIREAERMAGVNSTHRPVAIVGRWQTPCFGPEPSNISLMSFMRVADANLNDTGEYVVKFIQTTATFTQVYQVTVGELCFTYQHTSL